MTRLVGLAIAAACLAGCTTPPPQFENPFMGRQTIPPPGTGNVAPAADPYYQGAPQAVPPNYQNAPQVPGGANQKNATTPATPKQVQATPERTKAASLKPNEFRMGQTAIARPTRIGTAHETSAAAQTASGEAQPQATTAAATATENQSPVAQVSHEAPIRVVELDPEVQENAVATASAGQSQAWEEPRRFESRGEATDIMSLPPARATQTADNNTDAARTTVNRQQSRTATTHGEYGYDENYAQLSGQLEYSATTGSWKLRYIPIDGETDRFGGSVVLGDSPLLDQYEPGQFVVVEGSVSESERSAHEFAARYAMRQITPQSR